MRTRANKRATLIALGAVLISAIAIALTPSLAPGAGLATSQWPMFHRDAVHSGNAQQPGPTHPLTRWFQGGTRVAPTTYERNHVPHGPQGPIFSSAATSEVNAPLAMARKVWYLHNHSWTDQTALMLRSEFPDNAAATIALSPSPTEVIFETSAAMPFLGAFSPTLDTLVFRNLDPNNNLDFVQQPDLTFLNKMVIPAGLWTFDLWVTNVPAATTINFNVYRFPNGNDSAGGRVLLTGLAPVAVPVPATPAGSLRHVTFVASTAQDAQLDPTDGVAIGVSTSGGGATLVVEGGTLSRVETPIEVPAVYAGADDGSVWAFDAATGNVLWSFAVPGALLRSSPAVGDDGSVYIGSEEGPALDQGRLYAFNPNGTVKWTFPAISQLLFFRSGFTAPDIPTDFPADTAPLSFGPGNGVDSNAPTVARTGAEASGRFVQFVPRATNAVVIPSLPAGMTQAGWLVELNSTSTTRTLNAGSWTLNLALRATSNNTADATGFINYRISKVEVVDLPGPTVVLSEELLGWTQGSEQLVLPSNQRTIWANIQTPSIPETTWARFTDAFSVVHRELVFIELAVSQSASTGAANGGWQFLLEGANTQGGPHSQVITPALSQSPIGAVTSSPVIGPDDAIYFAALDGSVHAVQAATGEEMWTTILAENNIAGELRSSPALSAGEVYVGSMNGRLYALDAGNGGIVWRFPLSAQPALGAIESSPAVDESRDNIYFGSNDSFIYAVRPVVTAPNVITPVLQWSFQTGAEVINSPAIRNDGTIYVGSLDHRMYALNPDGTLVPGWPYTANGEIRSSAALATRRAQLFFLNETVPEDPTRLHLGPVFPGGARVASEIRLDFTNGGPAPASLPPAKFATEFRTRPQNREPNLPVVLPRGSYQMDFFARAAVQPALGEEGRVSFKVFHCTAIDPVGTLILDFPEQVVTPGATPGQFRAEQILATDETLAVDDFLRVEVWASATLDAGSSGSVFFDFDGGFRSHLITPALEAGTTLIYFASSIVRTVSPPTTTAVGRVYCLDQDGNVVWVDPVDGLPGFDPKSGVPTAFVTSPSLWEVDTVFGVTGAGGQVVSVVRQPEPVVFLGGQDAVMYAFGAVTPFAAAPPIRPPALPSRLTLNKQATPEVVELGGLITYTLRYRNASAIIAAPVTGTVIEDPLPPGVVFYDASDSGHVVGSAVTWTPAEKPDLALLWPGASGAVTFRVQVPLNFPVVDPLGWGGAPQQPQPQPLVTLSTTDPDADPQPDPAGNNIALPSDNDDFSWGQPLYVRVMGVGKPGVIVNSEAGSEARIYSQTGEVGTASPVTVYAGWGKRFRLSFMYNSASFPDPDPDPSQPPDNQPLVTYTIEVSPPLSEVRTGRPEETIEGQAPPGQPYQGYTLVYPSNASEPLGVMTFKVQLQARGFASSTRDVAVTDPPNRAWTPYYWILGVQQSRGGAAGADEFANSPVWRPYRVPSSGDPETARTQPVDLSMYDFMVHNPIDVTPANLTLAGGISVNPGTRTNTTTFTVTNISKQALSGTGRTPQPNVVRWDKVDLLQTPGREFVTPVLPSPRYDLRAENVLPGSLMHTDRGELGLGPGLPDTVRLWGDIPSYLAPGSYRAPRAASFWDPNGTGMRGRVIVSRDMPIYVDLNGNRMWDRGEAKFENEYDFDVGLGTWVRRQAGDGLPGNPYDPLIIGANIAGQPLVRFSSETVDFAKAAPGQSLSVAAALENPGNTALPVVQLNPTSAGQVALERTDLAGLGLRNWRETRPAPWDLSSVSAAVPKTPVGWAAPHRQWPLLSPVTGPDQPAGSYSGPANATSTVTLRDGSTLTTVGTSPFKVTVVERRLTGYNRAAPAPQPAVLGADIAPYATWVTNDELHLVWSRQRKADGSDPTTVNPPAATDPYVIRHLSFDRSAWSAQADYPPAGADPLDLPVSLPAAIIKQHLTPAYGAEANGTRWLFWGGSALRPHATLGQAYDNRLLWTDFTTPGEHPDVVGGAATEDLFRLQPQPLFFTVGATEYNFLVYTQHGGAAAKPWSIELRYRSGSAGVWSSWGDATVEPVNLADVHIVSGQPPVKADLTNGLASARDPAIAAARDTSIPAGNAPAVLLYQGYLWVVFSGVSAYTGNYDIYLGHYTLVPDANNILPKVAFARVTREPLQPDAGRTVFAARHKAWALSATPQPSDIVIYVNSVPIGGAVLGAADAEGWRMLSGTAVGDVGVHTGLGIVRFAAPVAGLVTCDYTPQLLRLSTQPGNESNPCAFFETYRYIDDKNTANPSDDTYVLQGLDGNPRLWAFWTQEGIGSLGAEIAYVTLRENPPTVPPAPPGQWLMERLPQLAPVDHQANEYGLSAARDPRLGQTWLFWSSTRGAPSTAGAALADSDLYYMAFDPELP